jgi:hypothetical protein
MQKQPDYWSAWMAGWVSATKTILAAQQRALEMFLPRRRRAAEPALSATAGDKPAVTPRRRGRPRQSAATAPRRRGRPPKSTKS